MKLSTLHKLAGLTGGALLLASSLATAATGDDQVFPAHPLQLQQVQTYKTADFLPLKAQKIQPFHSRDEQAIIAQVVKPYQGKDGDEYHAEAVKGDSDTYVLTQAGVPKAKAPAMIDAMRTAAQKERAATVLSVTTVRNPVIDSK